MNTTSKMLILSLMLIASLGFSQVKVVSTGKVGIGGVSNPTRALDVNGSLEVYGGGLFVGKDAANLPVAMTFGKGRTADGHAIIDLISDQSNYSDFGFRFFRDFLGKTTLTHRGVKPFQIICQQAAPVSFATSNLERMRISPTGQIGIGTVSTPAPFLLHVASDIKVNGVTIASDRRLKSNASSFDYGLNEVLQIRPMTYHYNGKGATDSSRKHVGVYAQELQEIMPELVSEYLHKEEDIDGNIISEETFLQIDDTAIKYSIINAVQEQQAIIDGQAADIELLKTQLEKVLELVQDLSITGVNTTSVDLEYTRKTSLDQNHPNPFSDNTSIRYTIPSDSKSASINFMDTSGRVIKMVSINHFGQGVIQVNASDLPAGLYSYNLVVNGQLVDVKKMVYNK